MSATSRSKKLEFDFSNFTLKKAKENALINAKNNLIGKNKGLSTYPSLDNVTRGGFVKAKQVVLFGATKSGKTTIGIDMVSRMIESNYLLLNPYQIVINWFSLELTKDNVFNRLLTRHQGLIEKLNISIADLELDTGFLKENNINLDDLYENTIEYYNKRARIAIYDFPTDVDTLLNTIDSVMAYFGAFDKNGEFIYKEEYKNVFVINVIDHIGLVMSSNTGGLTGVSLEVATAQNLSSGLFQRRNVYKCFNLLLAQANKEIFNIENVKNSYIPQNSHLYGSQALLKDADLILSIANPHEHKLKKFPMGADKSESWQMANYPGNNFRGLNINSNRSGLSGILMGLEVNFEQTIVNEVLLTN